MPATGANLAFAAASSLLGVRLDPFKSFHFLVEIEGILAGGFSECQGLSVETEVHEYREGGVNDHVHRFAGPSRSPNIVLRHGLTVIDTLWEWHQDVVRGDIRRRNGSIYLLDDRRLPVTWWDFRAAYPVKWSGPDLNAGSASVAVESVELAHNGLSRPRMAGALGLAAGAASLLGG
jgi:phage tail-like protein